jgi:RNA polymerase sigma-70 factor (ECF subfamily)
MTHEDIAIDQGPVRAVGEHDLVDRARRGDASAFDALVASRLGSTFRLAKAIVGDLGDAEDVTQEAFLQAWRGLPQLRDPARFDAWFGRIVVNAARMRMRGRPKRLTIAIDAIGTPDAAFGRADAGIDGVVDADSLQRAIDRLGLEQRTILALHHVEERPLAEIASLLAIPVGTVKWRLHEARAALARALEAER